MRLLIERIFQPGPLLLLLGLVFGLLFCAASVPFMVPDEFAHFYRAYQISETHWLSEMSSTYAVGGELPASFIRLDERFQWMILKPSSRVQASELMRLLRTPLHPEEKAFFSFKNTALYSPVGYLPQALGMLAGRLFGASALGIFYLGRVFNLLVWLGLTWAAIRSMPVLKWALLTLALMPMTVSQAASLSVDGILNGLCFLFIARIARAAWDEATCIDWREIGLWVIMLTLITQCKSAYLVLGVLVLMVPPHKFGSWQRQMLKLGLVVGIATLSYIGWVQALAGQGITMAMTEEFDPGLQTQMIRTDPAAFGYLLLETFQRMALPLVVSAIGYFGWLNQPQPPAVYPLYIAFAFFLTLFDHHYPAVRVTAWQRLVSAGVVAAGMVAVAMAIYVIGNPVNYGKIEGIQGRYFIPMGILLSIIISNRALRVPAWVIKIAAPMGTATFLVVAVLTVGARIQF
jgi:uncharacterized membrane protein